MEEQIRTHFFEHGQRKTTDAQSNCHWCQIRSFPTHTLAPITIVNDHDTALLPPTFRFISRVRYGTGVSPVDAAFRSGCSCPDDRLCQTRGCSCLGEVLSDEEDSGGEEEGRKKKALTAYYIRGPRAGLLREVMLAGLAPIYECHEACACSGKCMNRVVERGRTVPLQIFRTKDGRGWGVRSTVDLRCGQFVDLYIGEIITHSTAEYRRSLPSARAQKDVYLFELDKFFDPNSIDERLSQPPLLVDGEFESGPTRFVNHSCDPNLKIFVRVGDHADKHIQDLALFAIKDVPAGMELTFDYLNGKVDGEEDLSDPEKVKEMTKCLCRAKNCRGYLCDTRGFQQTLAL